MVQWGVLADTKDKGVYVKVFEGIAVHGKPAKLLLEGLLIHEDRTVPVDQTSKHPAFFPFAVSLRAHDLRRSAGFEVHRQGLDVDVVGLVDLQGG